MSSSGARFGILICAFHRAVSRAVLRYHAARMPAEFLVSAFVTLLVVVDPLGLVPSFIAVTHGLPPRARRSVAWRAALIAALVLAGAR